VVFAFGSKPVWLSAFSVSGKREKHAKRRMASESLATLILWDI
jgi:hypothetical protein